MNTSRLSSTRLSALLRTGVLAFLLALAAALPHGAARAQQGPLVAPNAPSPTTPTPFSWNTFHSGGAPLIPPATTTNLPSNPLASQLQGTPTGTVGTGITEIPSFLIGNYDYTLPPAGVSGTPPSITYFPNHFGDDSYLSWSAPFTFLASAGLTTTTQGTTVATQGHTSIVADDSQTAAHLFTTGTPGPPPIPPTGVDAGWTVQWTTSVASTNADDWGKQITDGTAAGTPSEASNPNGGTLEYRRQPVIAAAIGSPYPAARQTATWSFTAPTTFAAPAAAGLYSVVFHLPDPQTATNPADGSTNTNYPEYRISDAHYVIQINNVTVFDTDTLDNNPNPASRKLISRAGINQTETNDPQPLAGPFALTAGDVLTVTLDNTTTQAIAHPNQTYALADSVSLVPTASAGGSARQDGSPVAINVSDFLEIANALYYGFQITRDPTTGAATGRADDNTTPYGNSVIGITATTANSTTAAQHNIRQLVYFGRYEGIVLTDATGGLVDANGKSTTTPVTRMVGAIYCVDGVNGDVVWRFQTPDVLNPNSTPARPSIAKASAPVYATPSIARLNVLVDVNGTLTPETKLCVVAADDNGLVYCLDAIGNRNGTANNSSVAPAYNQPIYSPKSPLNTGSAQDTNPDANGVPIPHVGNTTAYWVYRPDAARPRVLPPATGATATPPAVKAIDPTSDLPVPAAFGLASPTVYVDPNTAIDTTTLLPGAPAGGITLKPNGTVYIGSSNGTLYSLDASGSQVTPTVMPSMTLPEGSGILYSNDKYNYVLPISQTGYQTPPTAPATVPTPLPSPAVKWWFAVNKAATTDTTQTANVAIASAPSIYQPPYNSTTPGQPYFIYFGTSNETTNVGNVFSVASGGPVNPGTTTFMPGSVNYNLLARPDWSFPNAYTNTGDKKIHAALGSISGSPVVFANPDDAAGLGGTAPPRVYFAANQGPEGYQSERPVPAENGRIWSVDATSGLAQWAYPNTVDPNTDNNDNTKGGNVLLGTATTLTQAQIDALPTLGTFRNSSPAIGIVQFPAIIRYGATGATDYSHTDAVNTGGVLAAPVPMLYVGARTGAPDSSNFFALDLDGTNDNERNIFYDNTANASATTPALLGVTSGPGFEASPLLVANPGAGTPSAPAGGNGGVVFAVRTDGTLNELTATPLTDIGTGSVSPQFTNFFTLGGFGVFGSPAVAGFSVTDLAVPNSTTTGLNFDSDWVYGSDGTLGIARGITPNTLNNGSAGTTTDYGNAGTGPDALRPPDVPQQLPLHVYLFDNTGAHKATSTNMADANQVGQSIAAFEWGQTLYIRVSNVVPPNPTNDAAKHMFASGDATIYYTNGGPIRVQLSDIDATGKVVVGRGADIATINTNTLASLADPGSNGFVPEGGPGIYDDGSHGEVLKDNNGTGNIWLGATSYAIGDGSNRKNTPGSRRQIISATQTVEAHDANTNAFLQNVILEVTVNSSANSYRVRNPGGNPPYTIKRLPPVDQPTFAVLNPLAVRGGGPNIPLGNPTPQVAQINDIVGPFTGIKDTAAPNPANGDLAAYVNGNRAYVAAADVPKSGVLSGDKGSKRFLPVTTVTTDIPHGSVGSNGNPNPTASGFSQTPLTDPTYNFGNYAFDVADRSVLGLNGGQISAVTIQTAPAEWNDNTGSYAGPGAVVNPLPWDDAPTAYRAGTNGSVDYPNISKQRIDQTIHNANSTDGASLSDNPATLDAASGTTSPTRTIQPDNVNVEVRVPKYQPANLQLYEQTLAPSGTTPGTFRRNTPNPTVTTPGLTSSTQIVYPMGYVARETIYVDSNHNHRRDDGEAFRTFRVFTGVPVDMTLSVDNPTLDLGKLPQTFGVQTDASVLGPFMPFQIISAPGMPVAGSGYQRYFQPISAHNNGNINLLNIHFDQRLLRYDAAANANGTTTPSALPFGSDGLSADDVLSAFDMDGVTGPSAVSNPVTGTSKFILRTSLDTDLVAFNRNPKLISANYPNATFHKARVSDANPPALTVPDVPHDNPVSSPYHVSAASTLTTPVNGKIVPVTTGEPTLDANATVATSYALPYVGLAVPLGTPVGAYSQDVRLFEGIDPVSATGYPDIQGTGSSLYKPLFPPIYGGVVPDGTNKPAITDDQLTTIGSAVTQPYSNPTRVRATITETRVTDGATYGNLPQSDSTSQASVSGGPAHGAADFLPVAFRSSFWNGGTVSGGNSLSLYWTSARSSTATAPYGLLGIRAPFTIKNNLGYFQADTTNSTWFDSIGTLPVPATGSVNTAISIATDQHLLSGSDFHSDGTAFAFVQNVATPGYQNNLYCYAVEAGTGAIGVTPVPVSADTRQPKFGARGLKYDNTVAKFTDALDPNTTLTDNLWAFWNGGTRGRSTLFYSSALASSVTAYKSGDKSPFTQTAQALPTPAGLSAVADPSAVVAALALPGGTTVPVIDITYTGVNADGNTDVYVSHYRPYIVRKPGSTTAVPIYLADANSKNVIGLALAPSPAITEQLLPGAAGQFYQARDVAWARADTLDLQVTPSGGQLQYILQDRSKKVNADGSYPLLAGIRTSYDPASGTMAFTNIPHDTQTVQNVFPVSSNGDFITITTVYADLVRGRVRLRTAYYAPNSTTPSRFDVALPTGSQVSATLQSQARRITTDRRADTEPVAFIDDAFKPNEAPGLNRVQTSRYWFVWRKSAAPGTTTTPTLYTKSQRLTLYLHDGNNQQVALPLTNGVPTLTLTDKTTGSAININSVDVDWARGRVYFPQALGVEGHTISATFVYENLQQTTPSPSYTMPDSSVHWLDEVRANDITNQPTSTTSADAVDTTEHAVPMDVAVNEGSPSAFLDPLAYADVLGGAYNPFNSAGGLKNPTTGLPNPDQPHKVWLFWNSTRSGTADVFYETIDPRFSANP